MRRKRCLRGRVLLASMLQNVPHDIVAERVLRSSAAICFQTHGFQGNALGGAPSHQDVTSFTPKERLQQRRFHRRAEDWCHANLQGEVRPKREIAQTKRSPGSNACEIEASSGNWIVAFLLMLIEKSRMTGKTDSAAFSGTPW